MPSFAELLAAKKKAAAPETSAAPVALNSHLNQDDAVSTGNEKTVAVAVKEEPANLAPKPMSFAEKMAEKKRLAATSVVSTTQTPVSVPTVEKPSGDGFIDAMKDLASPKALAPAQVVSPSVEAPVVIPASVDTTTPKAEEPEEVSLEVRQAYSDIKDRLNMLMEMSDSELEAGMKHLKKALKENPAAVALMEDSDIGKMVVALRKMNSEAMVEAAKEKKAGRKPSAKAIDLSDASVVAGIFDEL